MGCVFPDTMSSSSKAKSLEGGEWSMCFKMRGNRFSPIAVVHARCSNGAQSSAPHPVRRSVEGLYFWQKSAPPGLLKIAKRLIHGLPVTNPPDASNRYQSKPSERQASLNGPPPCIASASRTFTPSRLPSSVLVFTASAAAAPAASPSAIAVAVTRRDALASLLALWQRPATKRLPTFCGTSVR